MITNFKLYEKITSREELNKDALPKYDEIEPALMTKDEYLTFLEAYKQHPEDAYYFSLKEDDSIISDEKLKNNYKLLNTKKHGSEYIKYYVFFRSDDFDLSGLYLKYDENDEVVKDEKGIAISLTHEEAKEKGYHKLYDRQIIAVNEKQQIVGSAQNEWGAVLIYVVKEYWGIEIGHELVDYYRKYYPSRTTGGTTISGFKNLIKYHARQVQLFLRNGLYSDMVKNGDITKEKAKEIINSIEKTPYTKHTKDNVYTKYSKVKTYNKSFLYEGNDIMLINDELLNFYKDYDDNYPKYDDISEKFVFAHCRIHEEEARDEEFIRLYFIDGNSEKEIYDVIKYALSFISMKFKTDSFRYYITENTNKNTKDAILNMKNNNDFDIKEVPNDVNKYIISAKNLNTLQYNKDLYNGTKWFYSLEDKYDELKNKIAEEVYKKYN